MLSCSYQTVNLHVGEGAKFKRRRQRLSLRFRLHTSSTREPGKADDRATRCVELVCGAS